MKKLFKMLVATMCAAVMAVPVFATACGELGGQNNNNNNNNENGGTQQVEHIDYAGMAKLDFDSNTKKQEVTIRLYVDGDTTHFDPVRNSKLDGCDNYNDFYTEDAPTRGYAKARYIGINTPESTGQIEEWGKAASNFTHDKLANATSYIIESDDENWNIDSTGSRYLLWVWYLPEGETEYRNLNIDILQAGLAFESGIPDTRYADIAQAAVDQAKAEKLYVFSGEKDPDYWYGGPINTDLLELRFNPEAYANKKIRVTGLIVANFNDTAYIEDTFYNVEGYAEEGIRVGMPVYYSYTTGKVVNEILQVGNYVSVVGVLQYYATGGYYQITDIKAYDRYKPVENCEIIKAAGMESGTVDLDDGSSITINPFGELNTADFVSNDLTVTAEFTRVGEDEQEYIEEFTLPYREAVLGVSVSVTNLYVYDIWTTVNEDSASKGAMTLYCKVNGMDVTIRTEVLKDSNGNLITAEAYLYKTITVKGVIEYYNGSYQIKCHRPDYITVLD